MATVKNDVNHMDKYNALAVPPQSALKKITGGRLNGMTDIRPQWRYRAMTEQYGLCGHGWKYTVDKQWLEPAANDQVVAFVNITLYVKLDGEWSDGIPGHGGSMFTVKEKSGLHVSDEAYKMATTDALSVAMKMIGVASAIYEGEDVSKYSKPPSKPAPPISDELTKAAGEFKSALDALDKIAPAEAVQGWRKRGAEVFKGGDYKRLRELAGEIRAEISPDIAENEEELF